MKNLVSHSSGARKRLTSLGRVLIVDDSASMRTTIRVLLGGMALEVVEAADGFEALRAIGRARIDLVICDLKMPGFDGRKLNRVLAGRVERPQVIVISGAVPERAPSWGHESVIGWLEKPFDADALRSLVARGLDSSVPLS